MKLAFLADIHGNAVALEAVLEDLHQHHVDNIVVLGDLCYRGPEPKRALQIVQSLEADVIKGNADEWVVRGVQAGEVPEHLIEVMNREREWTIEQLDQEDIAYLNNLPTDLQLSPSHDFNIHSFHATPTSLFDIVLPDSSPETLHNKLMNAQEASLYVYAHIHLPYVRNFQGKSIANTGSVGLPFDGITKASYLLVEVTPSRFQISIERVAYDVEKVVKQYNEVDYPNKELMTRVVREGVSSFK